jgi:hypothetical protein
MNPLVVGGAVAAVLAGPPLYSLVQTGGLDSSTAVGRGLIVAAACVAGTSYVMKIVTGYEKEWARKDQEAARKIAMEAEAERQEKAAQEVAQQIAQQVSQQGATKPGS